jgi:hypothetical protein
MADENNPYSQFYQPGFGTIIGRPLAFNPRCDPHQRIFQETLLQNNTIIRVTPGVYHFEKDKLEAADLILKDHSKQVDEIKKSRRTTAAEELDQLNAQTQQILIKEGIDMRYLTFKPAFAEFLTAYQLLVNRAGTSLTGRSNASTMTKFTTNIMDFMLHNDAKQSSKYRGFNLWVEKSTSISETVSNSFSDSVFQGLTDKIGNAAREFQVLTGMNFGTFNESNNVEVTTQNNIGSNEASTVGRLVQTAATTASGAKVVLPQIWNDSKFDRSYNVSFRFMSPYGDDRSVFVNVILPFLFILACALPTQDGPSGMKFPFLLQMDCPGYFSCPMGVISNLSFTKGGSDALFNRSGLPLIIEGTFSVMDLYSSLSLPINDSQFVTNLGTAAFINNLVGASLYQAIDTGIKDNLQNYVKGGLLKMVSPFNSLDAKQLDLMRYAGIATDQTTPLGSTVANKIGQAVNNVMGMLSKY